MLKAELSEQYPKSESRMTQRGKIYTGSVPKNYMEVENQFQNRPCKRFLI